MKSTILTFTIVFLSTIAVWGQKKDTIKTAVFIIDLCTPSPTSVISLLPRKRLYANSREPIVFQIKNGNPFKYRYTISTSMVDLFANNKNSLDSLEREIKKRLLSTTLQPTTDKTVSDTANEKHNEIKTQIDATNRDIQSLTNKEKKNSSSKKDTVLQKEITKTKQKIARLQSNYKLIIDSIYIQAYNRLNNITDDSIFIDLKEMPYISKPVFNVEKYDFAKTDEINKAQKALSEDLIYRAKVVLLAVSNMYDDISNCRAEFLAEDCLNYDTLVVRRNAHKINYIKLLDKLSYLDKEAHNIGITPEYSQINTHTKAELAKIKIIIAELIGVHLQDYTLPVDVNGKNIDLLKFTLERRNATGNVVIDKYDYQIWIKGGLKLDVSGGLFLTSLVNNQYFTVDAPVAADGQSQKYIYSKDLGRYQIGFGSMLNVSYRTGSAWVRPALSVGALFSNEQKFQLLAGGALMLGKEQRVLLHYGLSMGTVTQIENSYETSYTNGNTPVLKPYKLGSNSIVPTVEKFRLGHFFGITYNFGGAKSKVAGIKEE